MTENNEKLIQILEQELKVLESQTGDALQKVEQCIRLLKTNLKEIREYIILNGFKSSQEEIHFFKNTKPRIFAKLIYYTLKFGIENKRHRGCIQSQKNYLNKEIVLLQEYMNDNSEFHMYFRRGGTELDEHYFIRNDKNIKVHQSNLYCITDEQFSTSHDAIVASLIAFEDLIQFLKIEIDKIESKNRIESIAPENLLSSELHWTGHKTDLIELIYALHSCGVINSGTAGIKELAIAAERLFNVNLGNYYHTFVDIRSRKVNNTKFIDMLKEALLKRYQDSDG